MGGWNLSSTGIWHTGHPLTVSMGLGGTVDPLANNPFGDPNDVNGPFSQTYLLPDGNDQTNQRPDIIPGVPLTLPGAGRNGVPP